MYDYYLNQTKRLFPDFVPEPDHPRDYVDIRAMILRHAEQRTVFFKDMAYYVLAHLPDDPAFMASMSHCFLVRDPAESILSYYRRDPGFTQDELGIEAQWRLYQALTAAGHKPMVIMADALRADAPRTLRRYWAHVGLPDAPHAFAWDNKVPEGWESVKEWHGDVLSSGAIRAADPTRDYPAELAALGPVYAGYDAHHRPFYEAFAKVAAMQPESPGTHQK